MFAMLSEAGSVPNATAVVRSVAGTRSVARALTSRPATTLGATRAEVDNDTGRIAADARTTVSDAPSVVSGAMETVSVTLSWRDACAAMVTAAGSEAPRLPVIRSVALELKDVAREVASDVTRVAPTCAVVASDAPCTAVVEARVFSDAPVAPDAAARVVSDAAVAIEVVRDVARLASELSFVVARTASEAVDCERPEPGAPVMLSDALRDALATLETVMLDGRVLDAIALVVSAAARESGETV